MKIEIEFEEVEALKKELARKEKLIKELEEELSKLDTKSLKEHAITLSKVLFDNYMNCVFLKLGFEDKWHNGAVIFNDNLEHWLGESWWSSKRLDIRIEASISNQFHRAFLKLGIKPKSELEDMPNS